MELPTPRPGLVIRYAYLWRDEADQGREEGVKDRPCVVVLTVQQDDDATRVRVAPVTHTPPKDAKYAVELPADTKRRLGLDDAPSWISTRETNVFTWPGSGRPAASSAIARKSARSKRSVGRYTSCDNTKSAVTSIVLYRRCSYSSTTKMCIIPIDI